MTVMKVFLIVLFFSCSLNCIGMDGNSIENKTKESKIESIVKIIDESDSWGQTLEEEKERRKEILKSINKLMDYDFDELREGIEKYIKIKKDQNLYNPVCMSKLFVINRYIFDIPMEDEFNAPRIGMFIGTPKESSQKKVLWPLSYDEKGNLVLTGELRIYSGPEYQALRDFDYFRKKYGPRKLKAPAS